MDVGAITRISNLPEEILEMIFDRLPFRVRQNAKLVCRYWRDILLARKYRKQEKIVVRDFYPVDEILDVLSKFNGGLQHLEFQNVYLDAGKFDSSFWIAHGAQITELCFFVCTPDPETFMCMAVHCANLESLYWRNKIPICSSESLDFLVNMKFSHKNLLIFETEVVSLDWLYKFRKVFPNAERMSYVLESSSYVKGNAKTKRRIYLINDGDTLDLPKISEKKLSLSFFSSLPVDFLQRTLISAYELRRLQEIEIVTNMKQFPRDEFLHIVRQQPLLEKFKFFASKLEPKDEILNFGESLLESLLETSPKLRWLSLLLRNSYNLMINAKVFLKMKSSQLSYLRLGCSGIRFEKVLNNKIGYENVQKNHTLRNLRVDSRLESVDDIHLLLQNFSRLEHLEINIDMDWFSINEVLYSIVTHQSRLKSLKFRRFEPDCFSIHEFHQLGKLKNLKYLFMDFDKGRCLRKRPTEFQFPSSLEYLYVNVVLDDLEFFEAWLNAIAKNQELRALYFRHSLVGVPFKSWLKFCSSMKNLEYLCIPPRQKYGKPPEAFNEKEFKKLFHANPSLRVIAVSGNSSSYISAVYNRTTEGFFVENVVDSCCNHYIRNSKLDYHGVDWLPF